MEVSGVSSKNRQETPRRPLENDDISPSSKQKEKQQKVMPSLEEKIDMLLANSSELNERMKNLELMQTEVNGIKQSQKDLQEAIGEVNVRVDIAEREIASIRSNESQENLSSRLVIRNIPHGEVKQDKESLDSAIRRIFAVLDFQIEMTEYEAYSVKISNKEVVDIVMKCSTPWLKARIIKRFREVRKESKLEPPFLVEKIFSLPVNHELNGIELMIGNKLTARSAQLLQYARKCIPSNFGFAFDSPEGDIMVRVMEKFHKISSNEDVDKLVQKTGGAKKIAKKLERDPSSSAVVRRSERKSKPGAKNLK